MFPLALLVQTAALSAAALPVKVAPVKVAPGYVAPALQPLQAQYARTNWAAVLGTYVTFCRTTAKAEYYIDCLSERLAFTAAAMDPYNPDTAALRRALQAAARDLYAVATRYHTPTAGQASPRAPSIATTRPLRAIAAPNRIRANAAATDVLDTTELVLLRATTTSTAQALAFAQVAEVIGTAKVLLRAT
ncbi:MAG: hypothetical protein H7245_08295 [Candidatus Saccharibacteria bacterium]|nr:hypothetical protein [Pseudorhodobacter sp.]